MTKLVACCALVFVGAALGAAQPPSPRLLVLNKEEATFVIVDPESGAVLGRVPTGDQPHELAASPDGRFAFASNYGSAQAPGHTISMIDLAARKELRRIDVAPLSRPHGLVFAGGKLYFTAEGSQAIARYDPAADRIDWQFHTGQSTTHMLVLTADLKTIFTSNIGSNNLSWIRQDASGAWTQQLIPVGKGPEGIALSPDGRRIWSAHSADGAISIVDVASGKVVATADVGTKRSNRVKITPDGRFALISDLTAGDLVVLDAASHSVIRRMPLGRQPEGILIPPDGSRAFVAVNGDDQIAVVDLKTWRVTRRLSTGRGPDGMAWAAF